MLSIIIKLLNTKNSDLASYVIKNNKKLRPGIT